MSRSPSTQMPLELYKYVQQVISDDVVFLRESRGTIQLAGSEAYENNLQHGEEVAVEAALDAIDAKVRFVYERSRKRWEPSSLTEAQRGELNKRKSGQPSYFKGLRS